MTKLTYAAMKAALENNYGCKYLGSISPPPYCSDMDMPDSYRSPDGQYFSVPQPTDGPHYHDFVLPMLVEKYKLKIINAAYIATRE